MLGSNPSASNLNKKTRISQSKTSDFRHKHSAKEEDQYRYFHLSYNFSDHSSDSSEGFEEERSLSMAQRKRIKILMNEHMSILKANE